MTVKADQYIDNLTASGEISFTLENFCRELGVNQDVAFSAIRRLKKQLKIVSPSKGYYLILTPEFRNRGCLPADFFIDDLMCHLGVNYYVCLLSAAMFHGAAHQQPQMMQVMVAENKRDIQCGRVFIKFIKSSELDTAPIKKIKTRTGYMNISTPEATAKDMLKYITQCGGMNRIATIIDELAESMDSVALKKLAEEDKESLWIRRLGYILDKFNYGELSSSLYPCFDEKSDIVPLVPYASITGVPRDAKWRIAINTTVESDLDDSY